MNRWSTTWWRQEAVTYCSFQVEHVHLRSSLNTHQNLMMLACSGGWGFAMKQEAVWGVWEAGKVMKFGRNVQRVKGSQVVWLWSLNITKWLYVSTVKSCSLCDVSRCTKHLLELNAKPRRKAAILNLKYNFDRLPGTSSAQHDLWWVQSKDLGDVKLKLLNFREIIHHRRRYRTSQLNIVQSAPVARWIIQLRKPQKSQVRSSGCSIFMGRNFSSLIQEVTCICQLRKCYVQIQLLGISPRLPNSWWKTETGDIYVPILGRVYSSTYCQKASNHDPIYATF